MIEKSKNDMEALNRNILKMGGLAREMLSEGVASFKELDGARADSVIEKTAALGRFGDKIEKKALRHIALYQPMAKDMRMIACILGMVTGFTRIGRYGKDIAQLTKELGDKPHFKKLISIPHMNDIVCSMIDDVLAAYEERDITHLETLAVRDDEVDQLRHTTARECLTYMMENSSTITHAMHYTMVARYLERCGDHACEIGEKVHYMVTGERIDIC